MTPAKVHLDFNSITGRKETDQARALRLVLAAVQDEPLQLESVAAEVYLDPRGFELALWELLVGMTGALAAEWVAHGDVETVVGGIRTALVENTAGVDHD